MIKFESIPQYTRLVKGVRFEQKKDKPYAIIYFPENSSFALDYRSLGLLQRDARIVVLPGISCAPGCWRPRPSRRPR